MRGATLIELLIAMLLAGIAAAGALTGLANVQRAWHDADRLARMHERAQYVFGTLEPELQMAGYFGADPTAPLSPDPAASGNAAASCGTDVVLPLQPAVRVDEGNWSLLCPPNGRGAKPGSDTLILRRASTRLAATIDGAVQFAGTTTPGERRDLLVRVYYIARAADGDMRTPALRVKSLTAVAGAPAFIDTEVMPGIDDLQIELLPNAAAPRVVRVRLSVLPDAADVRADEAPPLVVLDRRFFLRNGTT